MRQGFTLIELLLAVAIAGILTSIIFGSGNELRSRATAAGAAQEVASLINRAQGNTQSGLNGTAYGVRVLATSTILFSGTSYSSTQVVSRYLAPVAITFTSVPAGDIIFERLTGRLVGGATTTITVSGPDSSKQVIVGPNGFVSVQ